MTCPQERKKKREDMKRKEKGRREEREKKRKLSLSTTMIKREMWQRQRNFIIQERESARKEVSRTYLRFFIRRIPGKVNCPPPSLTPRQIPRNCLLYPSHWKILLLPPLLCSLYLSTGTVSPPPPPRPPSPFPFRFNVCIHTIMISIF